MSRTSLLLAVALPLCLTGCFGKDGDSDDDDDGGDGGGWDSGWSDGGGSDGGSDGGGSSGACPAYMPLHESGQVATYEYLEGLSVVGEYVLTYLGEDTLDGETTWHLRADAAYSGDGFEVEYRADTWYRCDADGAWPVYQELQSTTWSGDSPYEYGSVTTWPEPGLVMPRDISVGTEWTQSYTSITTDDEGYVSELSYTFDHVVLGQDTVEVPAGAFDALYIEQTSDDDVSGWYAAPGVGSVLSESSQLISLE